ncbi:hypothetical protein GCM10009780_75620 [Actinomadura alba]
MPNRRLITSRPPDTAQEIMQPSVWLPVGDSNPCNRHHRAACAIKALAEFAAGRYSRGKVVVTV